MHSQQTTKYLKMQLSDMQQMNQVYNFCVCEHGTYSSAKYVCVLLHMLVCV